MRGSKVKRLSVREARFLLAHIEGASLTDSYLKIAPEMDRDVAATLACRMLRRIRAKIPWEQILSEAGLGEVRLMRKLEELLEATFTKYYQNVSLGDHTDNATRMRATELLAELLGRRKADISLHVDTVEVIPAPKPAPDGEPGEEDTEEGEVTE